MNKQEFQSLTIKYNFIEVGEIVFRNDSLGFALTEKNSDKGFVYLWVEISNSNYNVVYVGKAGKTLKDRCNQHTGGFNGGSITGKKNADLISKGLMSGNRYLVYARKSPLMSICDEYVPSECIEELAFIKKLSGSLWNRA